MPAEKKVTFQDVTDGKAKLALGISGALCMASLVQGWRQPKLPKGKRPKPPALFWLGLASMLGTMGWLWWRKRRLQEAVEQATAASIPAAPSRAPARRPPVDEQGVAAARRSLLARLAKLAPIGASAKPAPESEAKPATESHPPGSGPEPVDSAAPPENEGPISSAVEENTIQENAPDEAEVVEANPEAGLAAIIARLTDDERTKLDQVVAALSEEATASVRARLTELPIDDAVEFLRDLLHRHSSPVVTDAADAATEGDHA